MSFCKKTWTCFRHLKYDIFLVLLNILKIITRKGGIVTVKNAQDWGIRPSRQKAFIDLINLLEEYPEGIDQA